MGATFAFRRRGTAEWVSYRANTWQPCNLRNRRRTFAVLKSLHPDDFETLCAEVLKKLGAQSDRTQSTRDGGVDFYGFNFSGVTGTLPFPIVSRAMVVGQAKRWVDQIVSETELRKFVGGALHEVEKFRDRPDFGILSPVVYAFWTTSDFDRNAREYATAMGIWTMAGPTLAAYIDELTLTSAVDRLLDSRS
ncbi:MAG: restriction endonuclease [Gammaproteobacteria bacterium]